MAYKVLFKEKNDLNDHVTISYPTHKEDHPMSKPRLLPIFR